MSILEVGSADGSFLKQCALLGHTGTMTGIDIMPLQLIQRSTLTEDMLDKALQTELRQRGINIVSNKTDTVANYQLLLGDATDLSDYDPESIDRLFSYFMLYHILKSKLGSTLEGFKRVIKPDGVITIATSGQDHKKIHRNLEAKIAKQLGVEPPPRMNKGFTTEKAKLILPEHFNVVWVREQKTDMIIDDDLKREVYINSQRTMEDQYKGKFTKEGFEDALDEIVRLPITERMGSDDPFKDLVRRAIFWASEDKNFVPNDSKAIRIQ
jgi:SAM-dependent methyltransferase